MFSKELQEYAQGKYDSRMCFIETLKKQIQQKMDNCTLEEQILMKFFYGTMPLRDLGEYDFEVFLGFVRHGLMLYQTMEWCQNLPEEIFLHHVLYYRINSENIEDCRSFFYHQIIERIQGKTLEEAVLEINYWCAENATYESTDIRTISPLTMYHCGKGRCGEESTFAVTAFRSVGIPARQIYAPWWAHCDDNHAWVEVYVKGKWHFLGACEPEEALNKGWFVNASSRSMIVYGRDFSDYRSECAWQEKNSICSEPSFSQGELPYYKNVTARYAQARDFQIKVQEEDETPAAKAKVFVEVLNGAAYRSIAALDTDLEGKASLCMGMGTVHFWAIREERFGEMIVDTKEKKEVALILKEREEKEVGAWIDFDLKAPKESMIHTVSLTKEQKEKNRKRMKEAARLRAKRLDGYYEKALAEKYPQEERILRLAGGNFRQLYQFLQGKNNSDRKELLDCLSAKDYRDARADVLEEHLQYASKYRAEWEEKGELEIYIRYILCPRIYFEEMTSYRKWMEDSFDDKEKEQFRENPKTIWTYLKAKISYDAKQDYSTIFSTPLGTWALQFGNPMSQRILCAAICRTLGIPARMNQATQEVEVYKNGIFVRISGEEKEQEPVTLTLQREKGEEWSYGQNWTIGKFWQGCFVTLDYPELEWEELELKLQLEPGYYRILTANRLPSGDQLASECRILMEQGHPLSQFLRMRSGRPEELLVSHMLEDFEVIKDGEKRKISSLTKGSVHILAFLEPGEEPTEHVLNEIAMHQESLRRMGVGICFIIRNQDVTKTEAWEKAIQAFPEITIVTGSLEELVEPAARKMYTDPDKLPLLLIVNPGLQGIYACSGYHAGSVKLMLELLRVNETLERGE